MFTYTWDRDGQVGATLVSARADVDQTVVEFDEANNDSEAVVILPGACREDVNDDGEISVLDIQAVAAGWGSFDLHLDVDQDGDVDIVDIMRVAARWGVGCP